MSKKNGKKRINVVPVNHYRKIALFINPIVLVILIVLLFFKVPIEVVIPIGVVGYGLWFFFLIKANMLDRKIHGK